MVLNNPLISEKNINEIISISPLILSLSDLIFHCGGVGNNHINRLVRKPTLKSIKLAKVLKCYNQSIF